jgi:hypothetical protein
VAKPTSANVDNSWPWRHAMTIEVYRHKYLLGIPINRNSANGLGCGT